MANAVSIKTKIKSVTKELIGTSSGDPSLITMRMIAEKADIAVGLINYHFQSKDKLLEQCVQEMIGEIVTSFRPVIKKGSTPEERLIATATQVMDFLMENEALSRISILSDMVSPNREDNSTKTMFGFLSSLGNGMDEYDAKKLVFVLITVIQVLFLKKEVYSSFLNVSLTEKEERDAFLTYLIHHLYEEGEN